jgi:hypothetical protein
MTNIKKIGLVSLVAILLTAFITINMQSTNATIDLEQSTQSNPTQLGEPHSIPFLTEREIRDPDIARRYGIKGYVEITLAADTPTVIQLAKGEQRSFLLHINFVSYDARITETTITLDPNHENGLLIEAIYTLVNDQNEVYTRGTINVNELITYDPMGDIRIHAGQPVSVTLTITISHNYPGGVEFLPIGPVGVDTTFPLLSDWMVRVYA